MAVLRNLKADQDELERLRSEIERLKATKTALSLKVSSKGGVSVYGLGQRWPVTLYRGQWETLLGAADTIRAFIDSHSAELTGKD